MTVAGRLVETGADAASAVWLPYWRPNGAAKLQLWCFPHAGGSAATFLAWRTEMPAAVDLRSIELPGRGTRSREALLTRMDSLIDLLAAACGPLLRAPFALFGHSMGATIAFEFARRLQERGGPMPVRLFVSGARAPHLGDPDASQIPPSEDDVLATVRRLGGTPVDLLSNRDLREVLLPVWRADIGLHRAYLYRMGSALDCPITAFGGSADPEAPPESVASWKIHTREAFRVSMFRGDHFFVRSRQAQVLAEIRRDLDRWLT